MATDSLKLQFMTLLSKGFSVEEAEDALRLQRGTGATLGVVDARIDQAIKCAEVDSKRKELNAFATNAENESLLNERIDKRFAGLEDQAFFALRACLVSHDERTKLRAAEYVLDQRQGRHKRDKGPVFNIAMISETISRAKRAVQDNLDTMTIDVSSNVMSHE